MYLSLKSSFFCDFLVFPKWDSQNQKGKLLLFQENGKFKLFILYNVHTHAQTCTNTCKCTYIHPHNTPTVLGLISTVYTHPLCVINNKRVQMARMSNKNTTTFSKLICFYPKNIQVPFLFFLNIKYYLNFFFRFQHYYPCQEN